MAYQIIHTFEGFLNDRQYDGMTILLGKNEENFSCGDIDGRLDERLDVLRKMNIDGLVINVGGIGYLAEEKNWELFVRCLEKCIDKGFRIWIYDEKGYPSGGAGGLVLKENPEYAAVGIKKAVIIPKNGTAEYVFYEQGVSKTLGYSINGNFTNYRQNFSFMQKFEINTDEKVILYYIGKVYEGTHSACNYAEKRIYINLLNKDAVNSFLKITHEQYKQRINSELFKHVEAFFTDEPSLMTPLTPDIDNKMKNIPVGDVPNEKVPLLAALPYCDELRDLCGNVQNLFDSKEEMSAEKYEYWKTVTELLEKNYICALEKKCDDMGVKLTGHLLSEETPFANAAFYGNSMNILKHFHIPGIDLLGTNIESVNIYGHKMVYSAAFFSGKKLIMTETNDFTSLVEHTNIASKEEIAYVLANQFLLGVNEFTYYYDFRKRTAEEYAYPNNIISRITSYAEKLEPQIDTAVYIPYESYWCGYTPSEELLKNAISVQPKHIRELEKNILEITDNLFENNIQFVFCDMYTAEKLKKENITRLVIPKCKVIDSRAEKILSSVEVYGYSPEYSYENGRFSQMHIETKDYNAITPQDKFIPKELSCRKFKDNVYFIVNRSGKDVQLSGMAKIYCPVTDSEFGVVDFVIKPEAYYFISR